MIQHNYTNKQMEVLKMSEEEKDCFSCKHIGVAWDKPPCNICTLGRIDRKYPKWEPKD